MAITLTSDITESEWAEGALQEQVELYRLLTDNANDLIYLLDIDGRIVYASPSIHRHCGVDASEIVGTFVFAKVHSDDLSTTQTAWANVLAGEGVMMYLRIQHAGSIWRWIELHASKVAYHGEPHVMAVGRDITERRQDAEKLGLFRAIIDQSNDGIEVVDPETGRFLDVNLKACEIHGYTREEYLSLTVSDIDPVVGPDAWPAVAETVRRSRFEVFQNRHKRKDGTFFSAEVHVNYVHLARDYMLSVVRDVTERNRAEQRTAVDHAVTRVLASSPSLADAGLLIVEAVCHTLDWDMGAVWQVDTAAEVLRCVQVWHKPSAAADEFERVSKGITFARGVGLPGQVWSSNEPVWIADVVHESSFMRARLAAEVGLYGGLAFPIFFENTVLGVIEFFNQMKQPDEELLPMMKGIGSQIGQFIQRKRAEASLRESNQTLQTLIDTAPLAIMVLNLQGQVQVWNRTAERMFGWSADEVIGQKPPLVPPEKQAEHDMLLAKTVVGQATNGLETQRQRRDGTRIDILLSVAAVHDSNGVIVGVMGLLADITERKQLESQFRQAQKMEAVGNLAGGIAHDFNNLLTVIMGYSDVVFDRLPAGDPLRSFVDEVRKSGARAASLTRQLLAFSRKQILVPEVLDLNVLLIEMEKMLTRLIGEDIDLNFVPAASLWKVKVDHGQMEQVIMNLIVNARDAMPQGGKLTIETANVELDETYINLHRYAQPGPYVAVCVSDTGCGMEEATRLRIFEPFFTTKGPEKGTGLGLSTVYGIVKQSNGYIEVYSELGKGSTFKVYLPRVGEALPKKKSLSVELAPRRGAETVLLVEDETGVRTLIRLLLEKEGYSVIEARNGCDALLLSQQHAGPIQLMVTDVVMPEMSGPQIAKQLTAFRPDMKVLFLSGYTDDAIVRHGILDDGVPFLQKPFTKGGLLRKVREVLGPQ